MGLLVFEEEKLAVGKYNDAVGCRKSQCLVHTKDPTRAKNFIRQNCVIDVKFIGFKFSQFIISWNCEVYASKSNT